jgi:hypothetical protein
MYSTFELLYVLPYGKKGVAGCKSYRSFLLTEWIGCSNYETDWMGRKCWKLLISMARGIWLRRNDLVFSNKFSNPMVVVSQAIDMIANFHLVEAQPSLDASPSIRLQSLWEKPPVGGLVEN